jgi:hypothetical protein
MSDRLRTIESRIVGPVAGRLAPYVSANVISVLSLLAAVGAGVTFWLDMPATVVYAVASRMIYRLVFLRRRMRQAAVSTSALSRNDESLSA